MVPESDSQPSLDDLPDRLLDRSAGFLVDGMEDPLDLLPGGVGERPTREILGDGIEVVHPAYGIGRDDTIADARERDLEPVAPTEDRVARPCCFDVVRGQRSWRSGYEMTIPNCLRWVWPHRPRCELGTTQGSERVKRLDLAPLQVIGSNEPQEVGLC